MSRDTDDSERQTGIITRDERFRNALGCIRQDAMPMCIFSGREKRTEPDPN
jgi:hypothetical protein